MASDWDPFADPADAAEEQEKCSPPEGSPAEASQKFEVGDFVEVLIAEGVYAGNWVACQLLSADGAQDTYTIYIPKQPPIVESDAVLPDLPRPLLRKSLAPANPAVIKKYYPLPWPGPQALDVRPGWYEGKPVVEGRKLRVLVLHGTSSNSKIMGQQISPLRMACKDEVEFIFAQGTIDASTIPNNPQYELMRQVFPGHTFHQFANYAPGNGFDYSDLEDVMEVLQDFMSEHAPIDGVLGTGQGSNLATLLAAQAVAGLGAPLSFAVHHGGTGSAWTWRFPHLFGEPLRIPSLHVTGLQDPFLQGRPVHAELYAEPETEVHSGDHRPYPRDRDEAQVLTARVLAFMQTAASTAGAPPKDSEAAGVATSLLGA
mmetsp:Transcript_123826/g.300633  ORF Transcript_123826/g.300633 Transcript_123826/m.300633 type:complete len:372 (-) Transcript_123826:15-1130(-)